LDRYLCMFAEGTQYQMVMIHQNELMEKHFKTIFNYTGKWLEDAGFYDLPNARYILENLNTGYGGCSWKPFIMLKSMDHIKEGDILFYMDVADYVYNDKFYEWVENLVNNEMDGSFFNINYWRHGDWTTKKCQEVMECDNDVYYNLRQLEAGTIAMIKNEKNISLLEEWLKWCLNPDAILKNQNPKEENQPTFVDHRMDQSILTNLFYKHGLKGIGMEYVSPAPHGYIVYNYFERGMTGLEGKNKYD